MSYDPYLDTDWTQLAPEMSYVLYLTDEEVKQQQQEIKSARKHSDRRRTERVIGFVGDSSSRKSARQRFLQNSIGIGRA